MDVSKTPSAPVPIYRGETTARPATILINGPSYASENQQHERNTKNLHECLLGALSEDSEYNEGEDVFYSRAFENEQGVTVRVLYSKVNCPDTINTMQNILENKNNILTNNNLKKLNSVQQFIFGGLANFEVDYNSHKININKITLDNKSCAGWTYSNLYNL